MDHGFKSIKPYDFPQAFDIYEVIAPYNVYLDDNSIVKAIKMDSIVANMMAK